MTDAVEETELSWPTVEQWAAAWFAEQRSEKWAEACEFMNTACDDAVPGVVEALIVVSEMAGCDAQLLGWVGAGPLEDLVSHRGNGLRVLTDVDRAARQNPAFRNALSNVWLGENVPEVVRKRLGELGARDFVAEHAMTEEQAAAYIVDRNARDLGWG